MSNMANMTVEVNEEIDDCEVMVNWWNEDVACDRYAINLKEIEMFDDVAVFPAYDRKDRKSVELKLSVDDFKEIDGVVDIVYEGYGNYRVNVIKNYNEITKRKRKELL